VPLLLRNWGRLAVHRDCRRRPLSGPSRTPQAELYAPLRVPVILVGDPRLGGISSTIAAFESLRIRGYDIEAILMLEGRYENDRYLRGYFGSRDGSLIETIPSLPPRHDDDLIRHKQMISYYSLGSSSTGMTKLLEALDQRSQRRTERLKSFPPDASRTIRYPFTQQKLLTPDRITAIDCSRRLLSDTRRYSRRSPVSEQASSPASIR
jgi:dethiobiotin synthetase/adenosylmethionine--8-amino-7-oxononanoate aminotransferase